MASAESDQCLKTDYNEIDGNFIPAHSIFYLFIVGSCISFSHFEKFGKNTNNMENSFLVYLPLK